MFNKMSLSDCVSLWKEINGAILTDSIFKSKTFIEIVPESGSAAFIVILALSNLYWEDV